MIRTILPSAALAVTLVFSLPANATLLTRTFVSSAGSNSNPCTITQPCASFQTAYSLTAPNGVIAALDPGKYGPLTIIGPVTINGNGWAAITAPASGNGITINAGASDNVALTGLNIDGAAAGFNGISLTAAGSLTVTNCVLQNFVQDGSVDRNTGNGIIIQPSIGTVNFTITNTTASNNATGIQYLPSGSPSANGVIDHVVANANRFGIEIYTGNASGGLIVATISNSIVSDNSVTGILGNGIASAVKLSIDNVTVSGNLAGIVGAGTANLLLGRSVVTGNGGGVDNITSPNTFYSYGDNRINLNTPDIQNTALNTTFKPQ